MPGIIASFQQVQFGEITRPASLHIDLAQFVHCMGWRCSMDGLLIFFSGLALGGFYSTLVWYRVRRRKQQVGRQRLMLRTRTMRGGRVTYLH
jgi:hypothetical protein